MGIATGTPGNDYLYGSKNSESDTMVGLGDNDTLNGRDGIDVAVFSGNFADYLVTYDDSRGAYVLAD